MIKFKTPTELPIELKKEDNMFFQNQNDGYKEIIPGVQIKTLSYGEKTLLSEFKLTKNSNLPVHQHKF